MSFDGIRDRASVEAAMAEFDRIGREAFLAKYGFGKARDYYLVVDGRRYDSKAILGAAHGYEFPELGPLSPGDFSGGAATVKPKLEGMGFAIEAPASTRLLSQLLRVGAVYTRDELRRTLDTDDSTINTGVFRPKGFDSVLLFVTEKKTPDRTQYLDNLDGDVLHWQGQSRGRTDALVIEHSQKGLELLLFYRAEKYEHPGAGFRYEGLFDYVSHHGAWPQPKRRQVRRRHRPRLRRPLPSDSVRVCPWLLSGNAYFCCTANFTHWPNISKISFISCTANLQHAAEIGWRV